MLNPYNITKKIKHYIIIFHLSGKFFLSLIANYRLFLMVYYNKNGILYKQIILLLIKLELKISRVLKYTGTRVITNEMRVLHLICVCINACVHNNSHV